MLPNYIIEQLKKREEQQREQPRVYIDRPVLPVIPVLPKSDEDNHWGIYEIDILGSSKKEKSPSIIEISFLDNLL